MLIKLTVNRLARIITIVILAMLLGFVLPNISQIGTIFFDISAMPVVTIFAFLVGFLINRAIERVESISRHVSVELSRLRRVHHLGEQLGKTSTYKKWFIDLDKAIKKYTQSIGSNDFLDYSKSRKAFREMTHLIYGLKVKQAYQIELFAELLDTTRDLALVRQNIRSLIKKRINLYPWVTMVIIATTLLFMIFLANVNTFQSHFMVMISSGAVLLIMELLWQLDHLSKNDRAELSSKYIRNYIKLD